MEQHKYSQHGQVKRHVLKGAGMARQKGHPDHSGQNTCLKGCLEGQTTLLEVPGQELMKAHSTNRQLMKGRVHLKGNW